jgi:hypothetical protein
VLYLLQLAALSYALSYIKSYIVLNSRYAPATCVLFNVHALQAVLTRTIMLYSRVMCEWQRLLLQQHTDVVASSNIAQWHSDNAITWLCVSTVEDLQVAIDVHTTSSTTATTTRTGSRCRDSHWLTRIHVVVSALLSAILLLNLQDLKA